MNSQETSFNFFLSSSSCNFNFSISLLRSSIATSSSAPPSTGVDIDSVGGRVIEVTTLVNKIRIQSPDLGMISLQTEDLIEDEIGLEQSSSLAVGGKMGLNRTSLNQATESWVLVGLEDVTL